MKWKNLKLGSKLAIGFGLLILITIIIGVTAIIQSNDVKQQSYRLANENIPEATISTNLEKTVLEIMYAMRGYGLSEESHYLNEGMKQLNKIKRIFREAHELTYINSKDVFKQNINKVEMLVDKYEQLIQQTTKLTDNLKEGRKQMDIASTVFLQNIFDYLNGQENYAMDEIASRSITSERLDKILLINNLLDKFNFSRIENFKSQSIRDDKLLEKAISKFDEINTLILDIRSKTNQDINFKRLDNIQKTSDNYHQAMDDFLVNLRELQNVNTELSTVGFDVLTLCRDISQYSTDNTVNFAENAINTSVISSNIMIIGLIIAIIIGLILGTLITRSISRPVFKSVEFAKTIANGDLTAEIDVDQRDEIGQLAVALKNMKNKLRDIISYIKTSSENIAEASNQMSITSQQISQGATEQASSVEEISSSFEEMSSSIQQNTNNSKQTEIITGKATSNIKEGAENVFVVVDAIKEIVEKISIIGDISYQTNILSLNAAVEAARAGEYGKGFAVVADEVKKLAERSQIAAAEINKVSKSGVNVAEKSGRLFSEIVPQIENTLTLVQEITAASIEQNSGAEQINSAVQQFNQVIQQNAASSEEMATSSEELATQAEHLKEAVEFFKTGGEQYRQKRNIFSENKKLPLKGEKSLKIASTQKNGLNISLKGDELDGDYEKF